MSTKKHKAGCLAKNYPVGGKVVDLRTAVPNPVALYLAWRKSAWYTLMRFRLIKNGVAHVYDVYTV